MHGFRNRQIVGCSLIGWILLLGCTDGTAQYPTTLLVGKVTVKGLPLKEGVIVFTPLEQEQAAEVWTAVVDGRYRAPGVPVGPVLVSFSAIIQGEQLPDQGDGMVRYRKENLIPEEYRKGVKIQIKPGETTRDFVLGKFEFDDE